MAIELFLNKDGKKQKYTRPNTNVIEMEQFYDLQDKTQEYIDSFVDEKGNLTGAPSKVKLQDMQLEFIADLFKEDGLTVMDLKLGIDSKDLRDTVVGIFKQISPEDFKSDEGKSKTYR